MLMSGMLRHPRRREKRTLYAAAGILFLAVEWMCNTRGCGDDDSAGVGCGSLLVQVWGYMCLRDGMRSSMSSMSTGRLLSSCGISTNRTSFPGGSREVSWYCSMVEASVTQFSQHTPPMPPIQERSPRARPRAKLKTFVAMTRMRCVATQPTSLPR